MMETQEKKLKFGLSLEGVLSVMKIEGKEDKEKGTQENKRNKVTG